MNERNYDKELKEIIKTIQTSKNKKRLLLHACCAPCSSYCLEYLHSFFDITVLFYNPNITDEAEYIKRKKELESFLLRAPFCKEVELIAKDYESDLFFERVKGFENEPEKGRRCDICYELRLLETVRLAKKMEFDYFCTTLSISPYKKADKLMEIGERLAVEYGVKYLPSDFKKSNGYKRSIELSKQYDLYRQNYCGCVFSAWLVPEYMTYLLCVSNKSVLGGDKWG